MVRGIFIAGSEMNAGKTTLSLGMVSWMSENLPGGASFMKALGQKTTLVDGASVGEDSFLVNTSLGLDSSLEDAAPFAMSPGASRQFLIEGRPKNIDKRIAASFGRLSKKSDIVVVEGTGHPGVGSVFGLSNAGVARLLDIPVLMVLDAGIGRTIDRFTLCSSLFHDRSIPLLGVVINRVRRDKVEGLKKFLDPWFHAKGIRVFGYIPYVSSIAKPSISSLGMKLRAETLVSWKSDPDAPVEGFITGFGSSSEILVDVIDHPRRALLLSASRIDVIDAVVSRRLSGNIESGPGALILCGPDSGLLSHVEEACRRLEIPLYRTEAPVDISASRLQRHIFKVTAGESLKISEIVRTVRENVDMSGILDVLSSYRAPGPAKTSAFVRAGRWLSSRLLGKSEV